MRREEEERERVGTPKNDTLEDEAGPEGRFMVEFIERTTILKISLIYLVTGTLCRSLSYKLTIREL